MRSIILAFLQLIPLALFVTPAAAASSTCTLHASGSDDAPAFLAAAKNASCATVSIPKGTTLNIETKMDMTELQNKHIVSAFSCFDAFFDISSCAVGPRRHHPVCSQPAVLDRQRFLLLVSGSVGVLAAWWHEHHA